MSPAPRGPIADFVDELSNWYVRLSRRRFWNVEPDAESQRLSLAAHQTMYEVLVTLSQLLAPFTPVHRRRDLPEPGRQRQCGRERTRAGQRAPEPLARAEAGATPTSSWWPTWRWRSGWSAWAARPARAPRSSCASRWPRPSSACPARAKPRRWQRLADEVMEELNVKALRTVTASSDLVDVVIHPLPKQLGSKYGSGSRRSGRRCWRWIRWRWPRRWRRASRSTVSVDGETIAVLPEEVEVRKSPKPGLAVAEEAGYLVAVTTELTDELRWEG